MDIQSLAMVPSYDWPEEAGPFIIEVLKDDQANEADRTLATKLASEYVILSDELIAALIVILVNEKLPEQMRANAAISMGPALEDGDIMGFDIEDEVPISEETFKTIKQTLFQVFNSADTPKFVRRRVLEAAVRAPQDWHNEEVRKAYSEDDLEWQLTAVFCMSYVPGFEEQILESLESHDPQICFQAIMATQNMELESAWDSIAWIVKSETMEKDLRLAAIETAAIIDPEKAEDLLGDLVESKDDEIRETALDALVMLEERAEMEGYGYDEDDDDDDIYN